MKHNFNEPLEFTEHMEFGDIIRRVRRIKGNSLMDFASEIGYNPKTLNFWELKKTAPPIDTAILLLRSMGIDTKFEVDLDAVSRFCEDERRI